MKHLILTFAAAISLAVPLPADSQNAVPRGGGGGSESGGSSGGSSSGSGGGSTTSSGGDAGGSTWSPPRHPSGSSASGRSGRSGGSSSGGSTSASPRRSPGGGSDGRGPARVVGSSTDGPGRGGRPITGYAVPRGTVVPSGRPGGDFYFFPRGRDWYYSPWYYSRYSPYYYSGFGASLWGLGYIWDPFWFGPGYDPYFDPFYGGGGYAYGGGGGYASDDDDDESYGAAGALRIKVKPREARVMVDGTFAGVVDDFDGNFQKLRLEEGAHKIVLQADGFEPLAFDVLIVEGQTVTYKGAMRAK